MNILDEILDYWESKLPKHYKSNVIRFPQVQMSLEIADFLSKNHNNKILMIEAPVGTGKSLGALIPAMIIKKNNNFFEKQVIYATATINLQGQLMREEVPLLKQYGLIKKPILAKGKAHYYCHRQFVENINDFPHLEANLKSFFSQASSGQRDEFESLFQPLDNREWDKINLTASNADCYCCKYSYLCPSYNHRSKFRSSSNDLIITNHDQLIQSFLIYQDINSDRKPILPEHPGIIIIDEAHDFQENFLGRTEISLKYSTLKKLKRVMPKELLKRYNELILHIDLILTAEKENTLIIQGRNKIQPEIISTLHKVVKCLEEALIKITSKNIHKNFNNFNYHNHKSDEIEEVLEQIKKILNIKYVSWLCYEDTSFHAISINFLNDFRHFLKELAKYNYLVVMSGTLTTNGDFSSILDLWNLNKDEVNIVSLPTSFKYREQALVYIPEDLVPPKNEFSEDYEEYIENQVEKINNMVNLFEGRNLILTTSKIHMNKIYENVNVMLENRGINLYMQGTSSVETLSERFKSEETSCLIGTGSFYSGLSVKGDSLLSVILTRLPFPVPGDPYMELLSGESKQYNLPSSYIPHMMIKLHQAAGRLIRDISDYGIITILDNRVFTKEYGLLVRSSFERLGYKITRDINEVIAFAKRGKDNILNVSYPIYSRECLNIPKSLSKKEERLFDEREEFINSLKKSIVKQVVQTLKAKKVSSNPINNSIANGLPVNDITKEQLQFANSILLLNNQPKKVLNKISTSEDLYMFLYNYLYQQNKDTNIVSDSFPYINDEQKMYLQKYKGTGSRNYKMSPEELKEYLKKFEKKKINVI